MGGAGGGQVDQRERRAGQRAPADRGGFCAVEGNRAEHLQRLRNGLQRRRIDLADRHIEAAGAPGGGDGIPQPDSLLEKHGQAIFVGQLVQVRALDDFAYKPPEQVARMGIVAARIERGLARQAAQDQDAGVGGDDRSKGVGASQD